MDSKRITLFLLFLSIIGIIPLKAQDSLALNFDGSGDRIVVPSDPEIELTEGTIEFWVNPNSYNYNGTLIAMRDTDSTRYSFHMNPSSGLVGLWNGTSFLSKSGLSIASGYWFHIAFVISSADVTVYINGNNEGSLGGTINTSAGNLDLVIGSATPTETINEMYNGNMDELRIWNVQRSAAEIQEARYSTLTGTEPGLVAYYDFNNSLAIAGGDNSGQTTLTDNTGNGHNGTLTDFTLTGLSSNWIEEACNIQNTCPEFFAGGSGTVSDPYQVATVEHLQGIQLYLFDHFIQISDINASETNSWNDGKGFVPIKTFKGSYDGNGFIIDSLFINRPDEAQTGLFGIVNNPAKLEQVRLTNVNITGGMMTGGLVGSLSGSEVEGASVTGKVSSSATTTGGLIGRSASGIISKSYTNVELSASAFSGGFIGDALGGRVENSYSLGNVTIEAVVVGGLIGRVNSTVIDRTYSSGVVTGGAAIGGLIGQFSQHAIFVSDSYWDTETSGVSSSAGGEGKTTSEMQTATTFSNWNFNDTWGIEEGSGYPYIRTNTLRVTISGDPGWRMLTATTLNTTFAELLDTLWVQGIAGGDTEEGIPNVYTWDEATQAWEVPSNLDVIITPGEGFIVYVYADDNYDGNEDGFPKYLDIDSTWFTGTATPSLSYTSGDSTELNGWNLVGNPYHRTINWDATSGWTRTNTDGTFYVWSDSANGGIGSYLSWNGSTGTLADGKIAPWQGFWVKADDTDPVLSFTEEVQSQGAIFRKQVSHSKIELTLRTNQHSSRSLVWFSEQASLEKDRFDAYKLQSLNAEFLSLGSRLEKGAVMDIQSLPPAFGEKELDLIIEGNDLDGEFKLSWNLTSIPQNWTLELIDRQTEKVVDLVSEDNYRFEFQRSAHKKSVNSSPVPANPVEITTKSKTKKARFALRIVSGDAVSNGLTSDMPRAITLDQNYPNPFNPSTNIRFSLPNQAQVTLEVFDLLGRKVTSLLNNETRQAGYHTVNFDAGRLSSGMYLYRLHIGNKMINKRMTLIK